MNKKSIYILFSVGVFLLATGISYAVFTQSKPVAPVIQSPASSSGTPAATTSRQYFPTLVGPKDQICPINGAKYTITEKNLWSTRRPLTVVIENHEDSRPQSGLSKADVVYEAVAEGAITRFLAIYYCGNAAYAVDGDFDLGPVRSARTYFMDWVSEYGDYPLYAHVGGAGNCNDTTVDPRARALCQIEKYGWKNKGTWSDLNQFALGFKICHQEPDRVGHPVATEHSMYCSSKALWDTAEKRGLTNVNSEGASWDAKFQSWQFKEDKPSTGSVSPEFDFWRDYKAYTVRWDYDQATNAYKRTNGGVAHQDFNTESQITTKNVVVQFVVETSSIDIHKHLLYGTIGTGKALIFLDGMVIEGKWSKKNRTARTIFTDSKGKEVQFNRGNIWIEALPSTGKVTY